MYVEQADYEWLVRVVNERLDHEAWFRYTSPGRFHAATAQALDYLKALPGFDPYSQFVCEMVELPTGGSPP